MYIGGKAMASKILYDNLSGKETAFDPENLIVIATGPLTGTGAPSSNRFDISSLSPLTGITSSSNCGGNFGHYLKKAGLYPLIIREIHAAKPENAVTEKTLHGCLVAVDGVLVSPRAKLRDGDTVYFFPAVAGG